MGAAMAKVWARIGLRGQQTTHGLRGLASTHTNEAGRPDGSRLFDDRGIEAQLSHKIKGRIKGAYDHAAHIEARTRLMLWWADYGRPIRDGRRRELSYSTISTHPLPTAWGSYD